MKSSSFQVRLSSKKVDLHAVFNHSGVGPGLVEICANGVGTIATDDNAPHAALIEGFCDLAKVIFGMFGVGVNDDDLPNVLFADLIDGCEQDKVLLAAGRGGVRTMHVNRRSGTAGDHGHRSEDDLEHVPVGRSAPWRGGAERGRTKAAFVHSWKRDHVTRGNHHAGLLGMNHRQRAHRGPYQMFPVELAAKANKVRDDVGWDDDVVFNQGRHRRLLQFFDDFGCTDHGLAQACVLHVESFKFRFFFGEQVKGGLVRFSGGAASSAASDVAGSSSAAGASSADSVGASSGVCSAAFSGASTSGASGAGSSAADSSSDASGAVSSDFSGSDVAASSLGASWASSSGASSAGSAGGGVGGPEGGPLGGPMGGRRADLMVDRLEGPWRPSGWTGGWPGWGT